MAQLSVAHCTLNPIELGWAHVIDVTPDHWKSLVKHVKIHFEDHYWSNDGLYEELLDEFIIQVGGESDESDDSDLSDSYDDQYFKVGLGQIFRNNFENNRFKITNE